MQESITHKRTGKPRQIGEKIYKRKNFGEKKRRKEDLKIKRAAAHR
jgi:hypothetical protein